MKKHLRSNWLLLATYIYIFLPVLLFVFFWLNWYVGIPLTLLAIYGIYKTFKNDEPLWKPEWNKHAVAIIIVVIAIITLWVLSSGTGASVEQYPDHIIRNAAFKLLVDEPWPVRVTVNGAERGLIYYIGFWLPSAGLAKFTSYGMGFLFQQIWAVFGIYLTWRFICERQKECRVWYMVVFIFMGGLDPVGRWLNGEMYTGAGNTYEWWAMFFNYPGNTSHLFWAFNQVIYAWLLYCVIMRQKDNKSIFFIWCASLLTCTLPAVGLVPFVVYRAIVNSKESGAWERIKDTLKRCLTVTNGVGVLLTILLLLYLTSNDAMVNTLPKLSLEKLFGVQTVFGADLSNAALQLAPDSAFMAWPFTTKLWMYLWFILLEIGLFYFFTYKYGKNKPLYWLSLAVLLVIPWIKIGYHLDFCERASIPAFVCLFEIIIAALKFYKEKRNYVLMALLIATLVVGSRTTFDTLVGNMAPTAVTIENLVDNGTDIEPDYVANESVMINENFSGGTNNFFYKYLAKKGSSQ